MKRWRRWLIILGSIVLAIVALRATLLRPRPLEVEVARAERNAVEDAVANSQAGTVKARFRSRLGIERAGRVDQIPFREGARVRRGDVLVQLEVSTARTQLEAARRDLETQRAMLESTRAAAAKAQRDFDRTQRLRASDLVSEEQMDQAKTATDAAQADLRAAQARALRAEAAVRLAQDELDHMRVTAPFDGVIAQRLVEVGESVIPGQAVIELVDPVRLYVSAPIDEMDSGRLRESLPARITLDPYPGQTWQGTLSRVFPVVNDTKEQNRTLEVEVELPPNPDKPTPKPGTSADIEIVLDRREGVLRIPSFAVIEGKRVLVVVNGKTVSRDITIGLKNWQWTEVTGGLKEGDVVVTNLDKQGVKAGIAVKTRERGANGAAASTSAPSAGGSGGSR
jgi:HlyD family secretion protein